MAYMKEENLNQAMQLTNPLAKFIVRRGGRVKANLHPGLHLVNLPLSRTFITMKENWYTINHIFSFSFYDFFGFWLGPLEDPTKDFMIFSSSSLYFSWCFRFRRGSGICHSWPSPAPSGWPSTVPSSPPSYQFKINFYKSNKCRLSYKCFSLINLVQ